MATKSFANTLMATATPVITSTPYSANDAVGGLLTFDFGVATITGAFIASLIVIDGQKQAAALNLYLFNSSSYTPITDNLTFAPTTADMNNYYIGRIQVATTDYLTTTNNSEATKDSIGKAVALSGGKIYGQLWTPGTPTYAVGALVVKLAILSD